MALPRHFNGENHSLGAPPGMEHLVDPLPVCITESTVISCWELNEFEKKVVAETGLVWLVVAGHRHPPVSIHGLPLMEQHDGEGNLEPYDVNANHQPQERFVMLPPPVNEGVAANGQ